LLRELPLKWFLSTSQMFKYQTDFFGKMVSMVINNSRDVFMILYFCSTACYREGLPICSRWLSWPAVTVKTHGLGVAKQSRFSAR